jgi:hypothetical protein
MKLKNLINKKLRKKIWINRLVKKSNQKIKLLSVQPKDNSTQTQI